MKNWVKIKDIVNIFMCIYVCMCMCATMPIKTEYKCEIIFGIVMQCKPMNGRQKVEVRTKATKFSK